MSSAASTWPESRSRAATTTEHPRVIGLHRLQAGEHRQSGEGCRQRTAVVEQCGTDPIHARTVGIIEASWGRPSTGQLSDDEDDVVAAVVLAAGVLAAGVLAGFFVLSVEDVGRLSLR